MPPKAKNKNEASALSGFQDVFFRHELQEDLAGWKPADLSVVADSIGEWARVRATGETKIRVFNPEQKKHGWHIPHTVIQIVGDDMPFIVDSVSAALIYQGLTIDVMFHPVLHVVRDKAGQMLKATEGAKAEGIAESYMHLQLEQMMTSDACRKLETTLQDTLRDVQAATSDWRAMLAKMEQVIDKTESLTHGLEADDVRESADFLRYLKANNFTLLGYRECRFSGGPKKMQSIAVTGSELGVMRNKSLQRFGLGDNMPEVVALDASPWPVMVSKLIDHPATVHRRVPMDAIAIKIVGKNGQLEGMHIFVGLFTSSTYSCRTGEVPIIRLKVSKTIASSGFTKNSHDYKALEHILEKMPRDELFQLTMAELKSMALGIMRLQERQHIALFTRMDSFRRYCSCLIYVPRDRYNTKFREGAGKVLEKALNGRVVNYFTTLDDSPLARLLLTVRLDEGHGEGFNHDAAEHKLIELGREWDERLKHVLTDIFGKIRGTELAFTYGRAFSSGYHESMDVKNAIHDIRHLEEMMKKREKIRVDFYRLSSAQPGEFRLKVYHEASPVPLSDILPVLENIGLQALSEMPYEVTPHDHDGVIWIHDFTMKGPADISLAAVKANVEETFLQVWRGESENDGLNQLALKANLSWREITVFRTYSGFMRQARFPFSRQYVEQVLSLYPHITGELINLFKMLHDPAGDPAKAKKAGGVIDGLLHKVEKLDHDRILRSFRLLIEKTLRTSYFQTDENGQPKSCLAVKLDSKNISDLPLPRPHVEIFVYSPRVEAVHLRGGEIARGGIRWSDRHDDFRTEVLGLMKSQMVKNTVIVPVGAKGGFIVKQPPKTGGREAWQQEGIACYKIMVQALLDITDNNVKGKVVRPKNVVCHDGPDPYLVVAADKGTATFSDIANGLSLKAGFWMGDAFASGGGTGYDHKGIAITARGGWESVKRHFREMGKDTQKEPFTLVGVGDMAGDVFGNAMLLSRHMRLLGAFNHVHIFCDPDPDTEKSFAERERLFKARGGWDAYDKSKISAGGAVFERSAKTLKLSPQIRKCFGISSEQVTPDELMRAILKAEVELIWFGGIGTFVKSSKQSHADADDKSNDALRVDARDIKAKVIGEGANLGMTQSARIEFAEKGGRLNTDFIDNSGGVDCSDHEVNIKILLSDVVSRGKLSVDQRNKLLRQMTDDVAELVLKDNYQQAQSLSLQKFRAKDTLGLHTVLIRTMEKEGLINRQLEGLPDEETMARLAREGRGLTRPELSILTAYAKMDIYKKLLASNVPDDPALEYLLFDYFPKALHKFASEIKAHKLRREIITTQLANILVNRMGPVFVQSRMAKTGAGGAEVARAFAIVLRAYGLQGMWSAIENLDNKVAGDAQIRALYEISQVVKRAVTWLLRFGGENMDTAAVTEVFAAGIETLKKSTAQILPPDVKGTLAGDGQKLVAQGMPQKLAEDIVVMKLLSSASDIIDISRRIKGDLKATAVAYFMAGDKLHLNWLRQQTSALIPDDDWQARVIGGLTDDFYAQQAALAAAMMRPGRKAKGGAEGWFGQHADIVAKISAIAGELKSQPKVSLEMLVMAGQRIGQLLHQAG